jgi:uncharacterized protein HemX
MERQNRMRIEAIESRLGAVAGALKARPKQRPSALSRVEIWLGIAVSLVTLGNTYGLFAVLPYRVAQTERRMDSLAEEFKQAQTSAQSQRELLVRIDERLKQVQSALERQQRQTQ